jgi:hypothetical protein
MSTLSTTNLKNASSGSNNIVLNTDGTTTITAPSNIIKSGTAVASTSGTAIDFTGIPSWVKRVTVMFSGVSLNGSSDFLIQLGAGSVISSGYISTSNAANGGGATASLSSTTGFVLITGTASNIASGQIILTNVSGNSWISSHVVKETTSRVAIGGGDVALSGTLDRVRITTVNGTDTFDAGTINLLWEG